MFELMLLWKILIQEFIKAKRKSCEFSLNVTFGSWTSLLFLCSLVFLGIYLSAF